MKKCAIYLRRSTDRQEQSIDDQRKAVQRYAEENGYLVVGEFVDDAISGAITEARASFLRMIEMGQTQQRKWNHILLRPLRAAGIVGARLLVGIRIGRIDSL